MVCLLGWLCLLWLLCSACSACFGCSVCSACSAGFALLARLCLLCLLCSALLCSALIARSRADWLACLLARLLAAKLRSCEVTVRLPWTARQPRISLVERPVPEAVQSEKNFFSQRSRTCRRMIAKRRWDWRILASDWGGAWTAVSTTSHPRKRVHFRYGWRI